MLNFFRRIRQKLLFGNSLRKYLAYAFGEILLIVIGILIALQINNWNEYRKERLQERLVLSELLETIEFNNARLEDAIIGAGRYHQYSDYVIGILEGRIPYSDTLEKILNLAIQKEKPVYSQVGYEYLKNAGFDIISNDSLKKMIIFLFEEIYPGMKQAGNWGDDNNQPEYFDHHFLPIPLNRGLGWRPFDWQVQMNDPYFKALIYRIKAQRSFYAFKMEQALQDTQPVLESLKQELRKYKTGD